MTEVEKEESLDYSLTLNALYTALYSKENPYVDSKESAFVLSKKPSSKFRDRLLEKEEDKKKPLFATPSDYSTILSTHCSGKRRKTASPNSGSHRTFLVTHLGGWRSGKTDLANVTDPIFHDNGRSASSVREEFCEELLNWKYSRDEKGSCHFLKNRESMGNPLSAGSRPISEYIVECNYTLISNFYVRKSVLRQVIIDFANNMEKAEEKRQDNGQNNLVSDPENKEGVKELCVCLKKIMDAYDQLPETESERDWLISRAFTWLVIAAFLREYVTPYVIEQCLKEYMFSTYQPGTAEDITEQKEKKAGKAAAVSVPELLWSAGKSWYDEARKPGARFHSLDIVDHILPDASDKPVLSESEHSFPFSATDKEEHTIQCSRFSELLRDRNSIYHQGHFMLIGEGGIGKTTTLMSAMYDSYEGKDCYRGEPVIPLFVELSLAPDSQESAAYGGTSSSVIYRLIYAMLQKKDSKKDFSDLLRECMNEEGSTAKDTVREYFSSAENRNVRYVLLVDGLNEVSAEPFSGGRSSSAQGRILQEITEMVREYHNVTVVLTGRASAFIDDPSFHLFYMRPLAWDEVEKYLCKKGKSKEDISHLRNGDKGLIEVLSIPMFLTMYVLLKDTKGVTTRAELMKVFFHERVERRNKEYAIHRQGDISERIEHDEEESVSGNMKRGRITLPMQWLFLDILIPEIAAKMVGSQLFRISEKEVRLLLQALFTNQDSLYCGKYKDYSNSCFEGQMQGEYLEDIIADFTDAYGQKSARYCAAFLRYCESSAGILYKEGENTYGFIHQHFRDYFAAVCNVNRMKTAYTAYLEDGLSPAREIMQQYDREPLNPVLMAFIGEYLGEHHNAPIPSKDTDASSVPTERKLLQERQLISNLFNIYRGINQEDVYGVYNLMEILKRTRKDLSGSDFHDLDLRRCCFYDVCLDSCQDASFKGAVINASNWFSKGHSDRVSSACFNRDGSLFVTASFDKTARIWDVRTGSLLNVLEGHSNSIESAIFSRDDNLVATASYDNTVRIWDVYTGRLLHVLEGMSPVFSRNGSLVATVSFSYDKTVRIWDIHTGSLLYVLEGNSLAFSRDGSRVATIADDKTVHIWDIHTGNLLHVLGGHSDSVSFACFNRDGSLFVTASFDKTARIWDTHTGSLLYVLDLERHSEVGSFFDYVRSAAFSEDGSLLFTVSLDDTVRIWDTRTGSLLHVLEGKSAVFSRDGSLVATDSFFGTVRIWTTQTGSLLHVLEGHSTLSSMAFNNTGSLFVTVSCGETACIWDTHTGSLLHILRGYKAVFSKDCSLMATVVNEYSALIWDAHTGNLVHVLEGKNNGVNSAAFSRNGSLVVTASDDKTARIWDARTGNLLNILEGHSKSVNSAAFSRDGSLVITAASDVTARIWDARAGNLLHVLEGHPDLRFSPDNDYVQTAAFSGDGNLVLTDFSDYTCDCTARIWDARTGNLLNILEGHSSRVESAAFSIDGSLVVTASLDGSTRIWETYTGRLLHVLEGHSDSVYSAAFSSNGSLVVTASADNTARIWDARTGKLLHVLEGHIGRVNSASFSRDGNLVVTASHGDRMACIWDTHTGSLLHYLMGHTDVVHSAVFSSNGSLVVTASTDNTARIWDAHTGNLLHILDGHSDMVLSAVFSRDGSLVVTASKDQTARIWDVKTGKAIRILYEVTGLHVNGVNFKDISPQSKMTDRQKEIFRQYGAIVRCPVAKGQQLCIQT